MATKSTATKGQTKAAAKGGKTSGGVTIKDIAEKVGRDPKAVRAKIRKLRGGPVVGRGNRYNWPSMNDPEVKEILASFPAK
jgi:hypothetical protein